MSPLSRLSVALVKISAALTAKEKIEQHHDAFDKDWGKFEKNLKSKSFRQAAIEHPQSDSKLKRYIKNFGGYVASKDVVGVVPSRTKGKLYRIKELPNGRLGCNCKDWQFHHSVRQSDCDHIKELKQGLEKRSSMSSIARGMAAARAYDKSQRTKEQGKLTNENIRRLYSGEPLIPFH